MRSDRHRNFNVTCIGSALVFLAISRKLINGAPANSISTVPVMPRGER